MLFLQFLQLGQSVFHPHAALSAPSPEQGQLAARPLAGQLVRFEALCPLCVMLWPCG